MNELAIIFVQLGNPTKEVLRRPARNGISCRSRRAWSADTASASTATLAHPDALAQAEILAPST
jgi:hypothetical protein